jgi:hypothetical protein
MRGTALAAGLLVLGAVGAVGAVAAPWPPAGADPADACRALSDLEDVIDLATIADQAAVRARAAALADALIAGGLEDGRPSDGSAAAAGRRIVEVLDQPGSTVADLVVVLGPVQRRCASAAAGRMAQQSAP